MNMKEYIDEAEAALLHTYNRYQIVWDRGDGMYLYDIEGKKYLDFVAGIAVFALGYNHKAYNDALKAQIDKVIHTSNYYYNIPAIEAAKKLKKISGMGRVFFTNSGAEAVEGAIKAARKYAFLRDGHTDHEIIAMNHSFHGRTFGALAVTGNPHYREAFMKNIRALCDEKDILLILDEIQCGMGRTGTMYAWQRYGVKPDIMTTAKAVGCGVPVGAFLMTEHVAKQSLTSGDHGTTYGGNPLACTAISKVIDLFEEMDLLKNVEETGAYLYEKLEEITARHDCVKAHRGVGLMQGLECDCPVGDIINRAVEKGLLLINAGTNIIRFIPPLIVSKQDIDDMTAILDTCF